MGVIAEAVRHMLAAGMTPDDVVRAISDMENASGPPVDASAERRRAADRDRKRDARLRNSAEVCGSDCMSADADAASPDKSSPTPPENYPSPEVPPSPPKGGSSPVADFADLAMEAYNETAPDAGWPLALRLTAARRAAANRRGAEYGGIEVFRSAMARARASPFLCGDNDRGWRASFDFFLQAKSFTKLMEGAYDRPSRPAVGQREPARGPSRSELNRAAMAEVLHGRDDSRLSAAPPRPGWPDGGPEDAGGSEVVSLGPMLGTGHVR